MFDLNMVKIPEKGMAKRDIIFAMLLRIATLSTAFCVYRATKIP